MIIENALLYHVEAIFKDDFGFVTLLHKLVSSIAQRYIRTDQWEDPIQYTWHISTNHNTRILRDF